MNKKVVIDVDGVLADFESAFCNAFGHERREMVSLESRYPGKARQIYSFLNDAFVYKELQPIQLGLQIVEFVNKMGYDVHIVTGRPFGLEGVTRTWLKKYDVQFDSFTLDTSKTGAITLLSPLCAVDDLLSVHKALLWHNIPTILVAHPWNDYKAENIRRINTLDEFITSFKAIIQERKKKNV